MIGVDTNIIVRHLIQDDENQCRAVERLVTSASQVDPILVNPVVAAESVWVLNRVYNVGDMEASNAISLLLESMEFAMPPHVNCTNWRDWFTSSNCDFSDVLIAKMNLENGCSKTYTLDKSAAKRIPEMELLT